MDESDSLQCCKDRSCRRRKKKLSKGIYELYGVALGCIRLSHDDFCRMSFEEFEAVYNAYVTQRNFDIEGEWERMRLLAAITIQPHLSKGANITPQKLIPLPWDKQSEKPIVERTAAEQRKRTSELMEKLKKLNEK